MKSMKKIFVLVSAAALAAASLTACGRASGSSDNAEAAETTEAVEISETTEGAETERAAENSDSAESAETTEAVEMSETTEGAETAEGTEPIGGSDDTAESTEAAENQGGTGTTDASNTLVVYFSHTGNTEEVAQEIADYTGATLAEIQRAVPYDDVNTEGEEELENDARPEITVDLDGIEQYDTIFVGYPIWWDEAPMVIDTFLESYDFSGKTLVPFCTSASDSIDNSLHIFSELAPGATVAEGLTANDEEEIVPWLNSLGYGADSSGNTAEETGSTENGTSGSNILIAYFTAAENSGVDAVASASYSEVNGEAKGRMQALAEMIQERTGGDLFSIRTDVVYPADGGELIDYAADEQAEDARPGLTSHIENLDSYDTIFIGYPNWWGDMPQALYSFFDEYDFSGKTIIPFNSHNGSRFSNTIQTIQELEPDANVIEDGFTINERDVPDAAGDIDAWLGELGY